ncbi:MAG TPA: L,D-transpeptidase [Chitinophagaceae bacterium]|nr:L,D-transpeptidase [Chitinophagaceae bacterium]
MKRICNSLIILLSAFFLFNCASCDQPAQPVKPVKAVKKKPVQRSRKKPAEFTFHRVKARKWIKVEDTASRTREQHIVASVNRADLAHIAAMDSILVPDDLSGDIEFYLPFPTDVPYLEPIDKIIFFSYPAQAFGAYENGQLVYAGPTSMGRKKDPTPTGLFYANWKAEQTTSTFNDEWDLRWNVNIQNKEGIGWHQYDLPGYPASHSCLRLLEEDARVLYKWADEWNIKGTDDIRSRGTPVIVFGEYDFSGKRPWSKLKEDPHALDIRPVDIETLVKPHFDDILAQQEKREALMTKKP